jgi:hypothetical protein
MPFGANPWAGAPFGGLRGSNPPPSVTDLSRNVLLLSGRDSDAATLVPSSEIVTLPASNAQTVQPRRVWRTSSNDEWLTLTFASAVAANALAMVGGNPTSFRRVRVTGAADAADLVAAPDLDTGWVNPWPAGAQPVAPDWPNWLLLVRFENTDEMRHWKIEITDIGGAVTYLDIGRLILGRLWQPSVNFDVGGTPVAFDPRDAVVETDYGFTFTDRRTRSAPRLFSLQITAAKGVEVLQGLQGIQRLAGSAGDVICCLDPGDTANFHLLSMQGRFTKGGAYATPPLWDESGQCWSSSVELREFL